MSEDFVSFSFIIYLFRVNPQRSVHKILFITYLWHILYSSVRGWFKNIQFFTVQSTKYIIFCTAHESGKQKCETCKRLNFVLIGHTKVVLYFIFV